MDTYRDIITNKKVVFIQQNSGSGAYGFDTYRKYLKQYLGEEYSFTEYFVDNKTPPNCIIPFEYYSKITENGEEVGYYRKEPVTYIINLPLYTCSKELEKKILEMTNNNEVYVVIHDISLFNGMSIVENNNKWGSWYGPLYGTTYKSVLEFHKRLMELAKYIIVPSDFMYSKGFIKERNVEEDKDIFIEYKDKVKVISHPFMLPTHCYKIVPKEERKNTILVPSLWKVDIVLLGYLIEKYKNYTFYIPFNEDSEDLFSFSLSTKKNIVPIVFTNQLQILKLMSQLKFLLHVTTASESFCFMIREALGLGMTVIAPPIGAISDIKRCDLMHYNETKDIERILDNE